MVKSLPAVQETQVGSLGQEDAPEDNTATHSSILAWRIPWTEEPGEATVHGVAKSRTWLSSFHCTLGSFKARCNYLAETWRKQGRKSGGKVHGVGKTWAPSWALPSGLHDFNPFNSSCILPSDATCCLSDAIRIKEDTLAGKI